MTDVGGTTAWAEMDDLPAPVVAADIATAEEWAVYLSAATDILWAATGRRWRGASAGEQAVLRAAPGDGWAYHRSWGVCGCWRGYTGSGGNLVPVWGDTARHERPARVRLPRADTTRILSVTIDGAPFHQWEADGPWLTRLDHEGWPVCHDRAVVTYTYGRPPPVAGKAACIELAVELARAGSTNPDRACRLPARLTSVTRQGIAFAALDPLDHLDKSLTGILSIDMWIRSVSPKPRAAAGTVWSPDTSYARRSP